MSIVVHISVVNFPIVTESKICFESVSMQMLICKSNRVLTSLKNMDVTSKAFRKTHSSPANMDLTNLRDVFAWIIRDAEKCCSRFKVASCTRTVKKVHRLFHKRHQTYTCRLTVFLFSSGYYKPRCDDFLIVLIPLSSLYILFFPNVFSKTRAESST